ncbi:HlyC/CorC family transporter [Massilia forsythiae]|uniref:HlyC/CorC family transporter n=1 Tax=Massilia forsythiae TaxID=2728020 RepID=A0A7Z2W0K2_9BURK|nr:hemolysin family protein [Massilia forsythiae]QJE02225.1 HlyC/CorC family transporter [Massilia forsythiae]
MTDILIILALILLNGLFAMSELAVVSSKRMRLERMRAEGSPGAATAIALADDPTRFLSTVQVGITLIGIFTGAFGEASLVARLAPALATLGLPPDWVHPGALVIVVIGITFASIVLGELVPKRIAILYPEFLASIIARPLQALSRLMHPFVRLLGITTDAIMRLLGMRHRKDETPTEEEVTGMIRESTDAGVFERAEYDIAARALRLDDCHLRALMTPRVDLEFLDLDQPLERNLARIAASPYSRFPVFRGDRSHVLGVVRARNLFGQAIRCQSLQSLDIAAAVEPILYVPESSSAIDLLEQLKQGRVELAMIVDEYGDIQGMVTLTDVMGALVGEVGTAEADTQDDAVRREDGSWSMDGGVVLDRFRTVTGSEFAFPDEDDDAYHTLAGFMLYQLGYIPKTGDLLDWNGWRFEVVDMDGNRIDRLLVAPAPVPPPAAATPATRGAGRGAAKGANPGSGAAPYAGLHATAVPTVAGARKNRQGTAAPPGGPSA